MQLSLPSHDSERKPTERRIQASQLRLQLYVLLIIVDQLAVLIGFYGAQLIRDLSWISPVGVDIIYLVCPLYLIMAVLRDAYSLEALTDRHASLRRSLFAFSATVAVIFIALFFLTPGARLSRLGLLLGFMVAGGLLVLGRRLFVSAVKARVQADLVSELVILDDDSIDPARYGNKDIIDCRKTGIHANLDDPYAMHQLGQILSRYDRVIVSCQQDRRDDWALVLKGANVIGEIVHPGLRELGAIAVRSFGDEDTVVVAHGPLSLPERAQKRVLDIVLTVPVLIALLPMLLIVALIIKLDSSGPVFFRQPRIGRANRIFRIYKFRSMRHEVSDSAGNRSAARDDDRITKVGHFIRRTSIDELPQLINVLLGDMSLVGPRPHALGSLAGNQLFWHVDREYWCRHALKPGITGLAQVRGFRGATHQRSDLQNRLEADLEYLEGWTLMRDVAIMFSTFKVLFHRNAF